MPVGERLGVPKVRRSGRLAPHFKKFLQPIAPKGEEPASDVG